MKRVSVPRLKMPYIEDSDEGDKSGGEKSAVSETAKRTREAKLKFLNSSEASGQFTIPTSLKPLTVGISAKNFLTDKGYKEYIKDKDSRSQPKDKDDRNCMKDEEFRKYVKNVESNDFLKDKDSKNTAGNKVSRNLQDYPGFWKSQNYCKTEKSRSVSPRVQKFPLDNTRDNLVQKEDNSRKLSKTKNMEESIYDNHPKTQTRKPNVNEVDETKLNFKEVREKFANVGARSNPLPRREVQIPYRKSLYQN